ncbi:hypothetical protein GDO81_010941 [Engystomops pustulosus]|uniref:Uncharacterized protein n=1 Tax=Engystomops pustulosus TaxID=76066 RepID=A0AAV7C3L1_ENGPU|nr:hypothetical protein GDO81_010941 [Engystomops pustulosus]
MFIFIPFTLCKVVSWIPPKTSFHFMFPGLGPPLCALSQVGVSSAFLAFMSVWLENYCHFWQHSSGGRPGAPCFFGYFLALVTYMLGGHSLCPQLINKWDYLITDQKAKTLSLTKSNSREEITAEFPYLSSIRIREEQYYLVEDVALLYVCERRKISRHIIPLN